MIEDLDLKLRNSESYKEDALFWIELANKSLLVLNKQLFTVAIFLLTGTISIVIADFGIKITDPDKLLLKASWIFLLVSLIMGLVQIWVDAYYFKYLQQDSTRRQSIWSNLYKPVSELEAETRGLDYTDPSGLHIPFVIQAFTVFAGVLLISVVTISILGSR